MNQTVLLKVRGMTCMMCCVNIEERLSREVGILSSKANYAKETVYVEYDPGKTQIPLMIIAIESAGYSVKNIIASTLT